MKKRGVVTSLLVIFSLLLIAGQGAAQKVRFGTSVEQALYHLPFLAAKEKGFWKEMDVDVEWVPLRNAPLLNSGIAAGEIDMAMVGAATAVQAIVRGVPQIVVADVKVPRDFYFWVRTDSALKEPKDLKGTKVAVTDLAGISHAYARAVIRSLGLEKEVKLVAAGGVREQAAAVKSGSTESTNSTFMVMAALKVKGEVRELLAVGDYLPKEWTDSALTAQTGFAARFPREVVKAIKGYFKATDFIQANRDWAVEKMKSAMRHEDEVANAMYPRLKYGREGKTNPKTIENIVNFLIEYGIVPREKVPPLEKIYDKSFAEQAAG